MRIRIFMFAVALLFSTVSVRAREHSDTIWMTNGDRFTGEIKGSGAGILYVDLDYVDGTISIQWSKVARVESRQRFIVKTQEGGVYGGTIRSLESSVRAPMQLEVRQSPDNKVILPAIRIVKVDQTSESFWRRLSGAINFGTTYSKGNQSIQYNLSSEAEYLRDRWKAEANYSSILSSSTGVEASTRNDVSLGALHLLPRSNYFYTGLATFLQSSEQGIKLQTNLGAGLGRYLKNTSNVSISVAAGMAWQSTQYNQSAPVNSQNVAAAMIATELKANAFKKTNLILNANVFPAVSDTGRVFFNTNATYYVKIIGNLSWNASFYGNWDNKPPGKFSGSDYGSSSGVTWTFGNR